MRHWPPKSGPACLESKTFRKNKSKLENKFWKNEIEKQVKNLFEKLKTVQQIKANMQETKKEMLKNLHNTTMNKDERKQLGNRSKRLFIRIG